MLRMLEHFKDDLHDLKHLDQNDQLPEPFRIGFNGSQSVFYAPFDYVNVNAKLVIVGLTPGKTQAVNAINAVSAALKAGRSLEASSIEAKKTASFSGALRNNLVALLDHFQINKLINVESCSELFSNSSSQIHCTSVLRYPVFNSEGKNFSGSPFATPLLQKLYEETFIQELELISDALFVPVGKGALEGLNEASRRGLIPSEQILGGIVHPSGANAERIAYQLGRKPLSLLSNKVNPDVIDEASNQLRKKVSFLLTVGLTVQPEMPDNEIDSCSKSLNTYCCSEHSEAVFSRAPHHETTGIDFTSWIPTISQTERLMQLPESDNEQFIWVPVAKDYTIFGPHLQRTKGFTIGRKGDNQHVESFNDALEILRKMPTPYWRRPSATSGTPGTVKAIGWVKLPMEEFLQLEI